MASTFVQKKDKPEFKSAPISSIIDIGKKLSLLMFLYLLVKKSIHSNALPFRNN